MRFRTIVMAIMAVTLSPIAHADDAIRLYAAGSLKAAIGDVVKAYAAETNQQVDATFGPSGLLRAEIEKGAAADVFASANMKHPQALERAGRGGPVRMFARNRLCAIAQAGLAVTQESLLEVMLRDDIRVGTSTPKADPSGDYAFALFAKAEALRPGTRQALEAKALKLTGGPDSEKPPAGRNNYGWVMESGMADLFLTYCTNARLAKAEVPGLQIVSIMPDLAVGADYGLTVLSAAPAAENLASFILSPKGQAILQGYGFSAVE